VIARGQDHLHRGLRAQPKPDAFPSRNSTAPSSNESAIADLEVICTQYGRVRCTIWCLVACKDKESRRICATLGTRDTTFLPYPELGYLAPQIAASQALNSCDPAPDLASGVEVRTETDMTITILIAWASLSIGIVMGAMWKSLCECESQRGSDVDDGNMKLPRLSSRPDRWQRPYTRVEARKRSA
jgi:hypothetical protein